MYLVDTSIWIDYLKGRSGAHVSFLRDMLSSPLAIAIMPLIYMEILQGARNIGSLRKLENYFGNQRFVDFDQPVASHAAAARIFVDARRRGVTIRSGVDCLIAQCAIENELTLFHHDRDFQRMAEAKAAPLREKNFLD